ncbi:Protein TOS4 [Cyberlindnera fabianii]|uniref:Protein TOS4 n=1 Tax=Cyberlindnera fabianii TaxID=36022 RepID=A0A1V2LBX3_CYBFA|nr:Protein TOS4 [Cyberlindnera fabianii]
MSAFPPSSPILEHLEHHEEYDPFSSFSGPSSAPKKLVINTPFTKSKSKTTDAYPTPNPSSSVGNRSSSPARQQDHSPLPRSETAHVEEHSIDALQPAAPTPPILSILLYPDEKVTIGRSSRCSYFLKSKFASREHFKLHYGSDTNELNLLCKSSNGVIVHFGKKFRGYIEKVDESLYTLRNVPEDKVDDDVHTLDNIQVLKDEQIILPYTPDLTLEVKGSFIAVHITNEESETEDEMPVLNKRLSSIEPTDQMKKNATGDTTTATTKPTMEQKMTSAPTIKSLTNPLKTPLNKSTKSVELAPVKHLSRNATPILKSSIEETESPSMETLQRAKSIEPVQSTTTTQPHHTHKRSKSTEHKETTRAPLKTKSHNDLNKQVARRRKAEPGMSPQKKKPDTKQILHPTSTEKQRDPREKIENLNLEEILSTIEDVPAIQNLLSNHLAFSRLSQTPLKSLQTVSPLTQALTRQQLRAILASTEWIGVIYRHGKDAAGKFLEEEYYYDVEKDGDAQRVQLVGSLKGTSGLRNCRKTHKQYFWKKPQSRK